MVKIVHFFCLFFAGFGHIFIYSGTAQASLLSTTSRSEVGEVGESSSRFQSSSKISESGRQDNSVAAGEIHAGSQKNPGNETVLNPGVNRAQMLIELLQGTLDPSVDANQLMRLSLEDKTDCGIGKLEEILSELDGKAALQDDKLAQANEITIPKINDLSPEEACKAAYVAFLSMPSERRETILSTHAEKRAVFLATSEHEKQRSATLAKVLKQADNLSDYLNGTLDTSIDPKAIPFVDLGDKRDIGLTAERRANFLALGKTPSDTSDTHDVDNKKRCQQILRTSQRQARLST